MQILDSILGSLPFNQLIPIVSIVGGMLIASICIIGGLITANRRQAMWHETARIALEKGQPLPRLPEDEDEPKRDRSPANDIRAGLVLIAVGAGLFLFLGGLGAAKVGMVGAIPGLIGVALLLFGIVTAMMKRNDPPSSPPTT